MAKPPDRARLAAIAFALVVLLVLLRSAPVAVQQRLSHLDTDLVGDWIGIFADSIKVFEALVVMFGVFQLYAGREERREAERRAAAAARKAAVYQAWSVINSAQGKGGSGGRVDALQELVQNDVSLAGVKLDGAWLEHVVLEGAMLREASFDGANLAGARLAAATLEGASLVRAQLVGADLRGTNLRGAMVREAQLSTADLRGADLQELQGWQAIASITYANIEGVRNAPVGFREWALERGALEGERVETEDVQRAFSTEWRAV